MKMIVKNGYKNENKCMSEPKVVWNPVLAGTGSHDISKSALLYIPLTGDVCAPCRELQNRHTNDDFAYVAGGSEKGLRPFDAMRLSQID